MKLKDILSHSSYRKFFLVAFGCLFVSFVLIAKGFGLFPNDLVSVQVNEVSDNNSDNQVSDDHNIQTKPSRIDIPSVGISTTVLHPNGISIAELDGYLLKGSVYYPGSGTIQNGNIFVFGHSTGLSVVRNQAFKAFNNLKNVSRGDLIKVTDTNGDVYEYEVVSVELVDENEALVQFDTSARMITLSTCNTFGEKQERHVVKAVFKRQI